MRDPDELSPDELATLNVLWRVFPDEVVMRPQRDHRRLTQSRWLPGSGVHMVVVWNGRIATAMRSAASSGGPSCGML